MRYLNILDLAITTNFSVHARKKSILDDLALTIAITNHHHIDGKNTCISNEISWN